MDGPFGGDPPNGGLIEQRPAISGTAALDEATSHRLDEELARHGARLARTLKSL